MAHSKKRLLAILAALGVSVGGGLAAAPHVSAECPPEPADCEEDVDEPGGTGEDIDEPGENIDEPGDPGEDQGDVDE